MVPFIGIVRDRQGIGWTSESSGSNGEVRSPRRGSTRILVRLSILRRGPIGPVTWSYCSQASRAAPLVGPGLRLVPCSAMICTPMRRKIPPLLGENAAQLFNFTV